MPGIKLPAMPVNVQDGVATMANGVKIRLAVRGPGCYQCTICRAIHERVRKPPAIRGALPVASCSTECTLVRQRTVHNAARKAASRAARRAARNQPTVVPSGMVAADDVVGALLGRLDGSQVEQIMEELGYERRWVKT